MRNYYLKELNKVNLIVYIALLTMLIYNEKTFLPVVDFNNAGFRNPYNPLWTQQRGLNILDQKIK